MFGLTARVSNALFVVVALLLAGAVTALYFQGQTLEVRTLERDNARSDRDLEIVKHGISLASISALKGQIEAMNERVAESAAAFEASKVEDAATIARLDGLAKASDARIATLTDIADQISALPVTPACRVPAALTEALKGL